LARIDQPVARFSRGVVAADAEGFDHIGAHGRDAPSIHDMPSATSLCQKQLNIDYQMTDGIYSLALGVDRSAFWEDTRMTKLGIGAASAALLLLTCTTMPAARAAECPVLVGPDWSGETLSPDPARLLSISDVYHARMIYEPLVAADSAMQPVPWLAESWDVNDTPRRTFHIRQGVTFHGSPLTADDVVYIPPLARSGSWLTGSK
jgi:hypothetical protein